MSERTPTLSDAHPGRVLPSGEREMFLDVRTQDMEINFGPQEGNGETTSSDGRITTAVNIP